MKEPGRRDSVCLQDGFFLMALEQSLLLVVGWSGGGGVGRWSGVAWGWGVCVTQSLPARPTLPHQPLQTSAASSAPRFDTHRTLGLADLVATWPRKFCRWLGALVAESRRSTHRGLCQRRL